MSRKRETVERVIDGDTFQTRSRTHSVRLANVNAPEKGTRKGNAATKILKSMIQGKKVEVNIVARDKYARAIANVKLDGKSVNKAMNQKLKK